MTMLLAQHGIMGNVSGGLVPTDKTKTYALSATLDETRYYLNSLLHQNPKDKRIVIHTFIDSVNHVADTGKKFVYRLSSDRGATFGSKTTLYDPTDGTMQVQDPSAGMDRKGRLHIFADCHEGVGSGATGLDHEVRYMYSDDNGVTVSSPSVISFPATSLATFRFYGRCIDTGSVLIQPVYFFTDENTFTNSERWVLRSTDYGANWSWVLVEATTDYINESECLAINNNVVFMISRYEPIKLTYMMYKSIDAGATWVRVGLLGTGISPVTAAPCRLHKFRADNGKWWAAMYFPNKDNGSVYAMYGRLDNGVDGGLGLFNSTTLTLLRDDTVTLHYGDFLHYNGNLNCRGAWPRENGSFPTDNELIYFENLSTHYNTVFAIIDPVTIYDKVAVPMTIFTWRGMVTNTNNDYGAVNGSGQVTAWKSILPGPLSQNFTATAGGIVLDSDGLTFDGTKALSHATSTYWNFMHYSGAGESDINYTVYAKLKIGIASNPNAAYGIFGDNGASAVNKGASLFYDDRVAVPASDRMALKISKGSAGFIIDFVNDDVITPNVFHVVCIEVDLSQSTTNNKVKLYVDNVLISTTVTTYNTGVVNNPTYNMQIGATGNNALPFIGTMKEMIFQNAIDLPAVRTNFTQALIDAV
jgi:hypothetical protein